MTQSSQGFQTQVYAQPAPAVEGDFCNSNPRYAVIAGPGGLVAGPSGALVARFCWATSPVDGDNTPATVTNSGSGPVTGFLHREQQALITTYLAEAGNLVQPGTQLTLMSNADVWVKNRGATQALVGQTCYAALANGGAAFAAAGSPPGGAVASAGSSWSIAAETSTITATQNGGILTVSAESGTYGVAIGALLTGGTGAGSNYIQSQVLPLLAGEALNGIGRYYVTVPDQTNVTYTGLSFGLLTLTTVASGTFAVGSTLTVSGTAIAAGTTITQLLTGTGGSGSTAIVNLTQTSSQASNGTLTGATYVATKWLAMSGGLANDLIKISAQPLG